MYQQVLRRFAHFNAIQLSDPAPLPELIMLALKEEDTDADGSDNDDLRKKIAEVITSLFIHFSWKSLWVLGLGTPSTLSSTIYIGMLLVLVLVWLTSQSMVSGTVI